MKLLYTNKKGDLFVDRNLEAAAERGGEILAAEDFIPMPEGATLTSLPYRTPMGINARGFAQASESGGWPVAALLPQGYTRTLLPAYETPENVPEKVLPLLGYSAVAMEDGQLMVAAVQTDEAEPWHPDNYNTKDLPRRIERVRGLFPNNRIIKQLAYCAMEYGCFTAQNIFYRRWEGGLPVSKYCNAACVGCISKQESQCCPSAQGRIDFRPRVKEIAEVGFFHLTAKQPDNIISFGQGCEGEPSLEAERISKAIGIIRDSTTAGTININTNAGNTASIRQIVDSGLDTMRVSLFSAIPDHYQAYYRPKGYELEDVANSIKYSVNKGVYVSLNLLTFPGYTDREEEIDALLDFIDETGLQKVQLRNLNIDCEYFYDSMNIEKAPSLGVDELIKAFKENGVEVGNYTTPV
ncbi:MAG: radical SAM protein, partial [Bacillota bacterium]|nr:radical SAM protein [Bacillota bacterium]